MYSTSVTPQRVLEQLRRGRPFQPRRTEVPKVIDVGPLAQDLADWRENVVITTSVWNRLAARGRVDATYRGRRYLEAHVRSILTSAAAAARHGGSVRFQVCLTPSSRPVSLALRRTVGPRGRLVVLAWPTESI